MRLLGVFPTARWKEDPSFPEYIREMEDEHQYTGFGA